MNKHPWLELKNWAVIGASTKTTGYGHRITKALMDNGYNVIPVSPNHDEVEGLVCYDSLLDYEGPIDVVDFVVNPVIGMVTLDQVVEKGVKKILLQPGTASEGLIAKAEANEIEVLQSCILVLLSWR